VFTSVAVFDPPC